MKKIKIFLASSNELKAERDQFELQIYHKCKAWFDKEIFLHVDTWEDLSAKMSTTRSQDEYNKVLKDSDLFVLLAYTKVGMYTAEEFDQAFGVFDAVQKPFIFTYFKDADSSTEESLDSFKQKLSKLGHFYSSFQDSNDLWNQFNKELDRLGENEFVEFKPQSKTKSSSTFEATNFEAGEGVGIKAKQKSSDAKFDNLKAGGKIDIDIQQE